MIKRDKPLLFHWRAADPSWIDDLDLPESRSAKRDAARSAILVDAALSGIIEPERWISYSRRHDWWAEGKRYRDSAFTYETVPSAIDELSRLELLAHDKSEPGSRGRQSRFRATPALLEAARPRLLSPTHAAPAVIYQPQEAIRLRNSDRPPKQIDYEDNPYTRAMRREMREINGALRATVVDLPVADLPRDGPFLRIGDAVLNQSVDLLHRVFSRGSFSMNGRLVGTWWQNVPSALRQELTINGETTWELDYGNQHLRMLYAEAAVPMGDGDAYDIDGWPRPLIKRATMALINARGEAEAVKVICDHRDGSEALTGPGAHARARKLIEDIKRRHAPVAHLFHSDQGIRLMRKDAELATSIMGGMRNRGVVVLPVHDSFITDKRYAGNLREEMEAAWHDQIGAENPAITPPFGKNVPHNGGEFPPVGLVVVVPVGGSDLFGGRAVPEGLGSWSSGRAPEKIRHFLRDEMRDKNLSGADLAREIGISRPQLVNVLRGRFGTTPRVAESLKSWAIEGR